MSSYEIRARYVPGLVSALPVIVFSGFIKDEVWIALFRNVGWFLVVENISISMVAVLFLIHVQRGIAKHVFEDRVFDSGKNFPTTQMLLWSNDYLSKGMKQRLHEKIATTCGIALLDEEDEQDNVDEAKRTIRDAVGLVRKQVGDGDKTLQYNIHYGFSRNLIGGSTLAAPTALVCTVIAVVQKDVAALVASGVMTLAFAVALLMSRTIMTHFGNAYAECLLTEYLTTNTETTNE